VTLRRGVPTLLAGTLALAYVVVSPRSIDLAAHLLRAELFGAEGFGLWNNWWYGGHHILGYSVLFPPVAWLLTPQVAAAIAVTGAAAAFEVLAHDHFGEDAWLGAVWFGAATLAVLLSGRLTFAFGLLPAIGAALALERRRPFPAAGLAVVTALASPVAALFAALAGAATAIGARRRVDRLDGAGVVLAALVPVVALAVAFPEGGTEPFAFSVLWPVVALVALLLAALPAEERVLRVGVVLYGAGVIAAYAVATPVGSNAARLATLLAGPLLAMVRWRRRPAWLLVAALPLLYLQWHAAVRDVRAAERDPSTTAAYYRPLLRFLGSRPGAPFRLEIPFTASHWEAYEVAPHVPLARGWERQLDRRDNALFYTGRLTAGRYRAWLRQLAVHFVAVPDVPLDSSALQEAALIERGLPYLREVWRSRHWRVYAVRDATALASGAATARALGPDSVTLEARRAGRALVRVRYTPYWSLSGGHGCVSPAGDLTSVSLRHPGRVRLVVDFSLSRIRAQSPRCG
jgi:hypothetical protein